MTPEFLLHLSSEGAALDQRSADGLAGWYRLDSIPIDDDFLTKTTAMAQAAQTSIGGPVECLVTIPLDQMKALTLPTTGLLPADVEAALQGQTPYAVADLAFDWKVSKGQTHVLAVARETLDEAKEFATSNGFSPIGFASLPLGEWGDSFAYFGPADGKEAQRPTMPFALVPAPIRSDAHAPIDTTQPAETAPTAEISPPPVEVSTEETKDVVPASVEDTTPVAPIPATVGQEQPVTQDENSPEPVDAPDETVSPPEQKIPEETASVPSIEASLGDTGVAETPSVPEKQEPKSDPEPKTEVQADAPKEPKLTPQAEKQKTPAEKPVLVAKNDLDETPSAAPPLRVEPEKPISPSQASAEGKKPVAFAVPRGTGTDKQDAPATPDAKDAAPAITTKVTGTATAKADNKPTKPTTSKPDAKAIARSKAASKGAVAGKSQFDTPQAKEKKNRSVLAIILTAILIVLLLTFGVFAATVGRDTIVTWFNGLTGNGATAPTVASAPQAINPEPENTPQQIVEDVADQNDPSIIKPFELPLSYLVAGQSSITPNTSWLDPRPTVASLEDLVHDASKHVTASLASWTLTEIQAGKPVQNLAVTGIPIAALFENDPMADILDFPAVQTSWSTARDQLRVPFDPAPSMVAFLDSDNLSDRLKPSVARYFSSGVWPNPPEDIQNVEGPDSPPVLKARLDRPTTAPLRLQQNSVQDEALDDKPQFLFPEGRLPGGVIVVFGPPPKKPETRPLPERPDWAKKRPQLRPENLVDDTITSGDVQIDVLTPIIPAPEATIEPALNIDALPDAPVDFAALTETPAPVIADILPQLVPQVADAPDFLGNPQAPTVIDPIAPIPTNDTTVALSIAPNEIAPLVPVVFGKPPKVPEIRGGIIRDDAVESARSTILSNPVQIQPEQLDKVIKPVSAENAVVTRQAFQPSQPLVQPDLKNVSALLPTLPDATPGIPELGNTEGETADEAEIQTVAMVPLLPSKRPSLRPVEYETAALRQAIMGDKSPLMRPKSLELSQTKPDDNNRPEAPSTSDQASAVSQPQSLDAVGSAALQATVSKIVNNSRAQVIASKRPQVRPKSLTAAAPTEVATAQKTAASAVAKPTAQSARSVTQNATVKNVLNLRRINLIGTFGPANKKGAIVRLPNGKIARVNVGDRLDGGRVVAIDQKNLRYTKGGRTIVLKLPKI